MGLLWSTELCWSTGLCWSPGLCWSLELCWSVGLLLVYWAVGHDIRVLSLAALPMRRLEQHFRTTEALTTHGDDITVCELIRFLLGAALGRSLHPKIKRQGNATRRIKDNLHVRIKRQGNATQMRMAKTMAISNVAASSEAGILNWEPIFGDRGPREPHFGTRFWGRV